MTKQDIENTVSLFYPAGIKVYYINSASGSELTPPYRRVFVSLGITSSIKTISEIKDSLNNINYLNATLATLKTTRNASGRYFNEVVRIGDYTKDDQYIATKITGGEFEKILDRAAALDVYEELLHSEHVEQANELKELIRRLDEKDCWDTLAVCFNIIDNVPTISPFHRYINYYVDPENGTEYRIGILVEEKKK